MTHGNSRSRAITGHSRKPLIAAVQERYDLQACSIKPMLANRFPSMRAAGEELGYAAARDAARGQNEEAEDHRTIEQLPRAINIAASAG